MVELKQLASQLMCTNCDFPLSLKDSVEEKQHRLAFEMIIKCRVCLENSQVFTGKKSKINPKLFAMNCKVTSGTFCSQLSMAYR